MIDFDREEFLARFDIRVATIISALANHEKYLCSNMPHKDFEKAQKHIDKLSKQLTLYIAKTDQKIRENFWNLKKEFEKYKENCDND